MQQPYPAQPGMSAMPPGYGQGQHYQQQPQGNWSPAQQQPAIQTSQIRGGYASGDRLPAMPEMMRRPPAAAAPAQRQPVVRGAAPEMAVQSPASTPAPVSSPGWQPIRIPSPNELGITAARTRPELAPAMLVSTASAQPLPSRYDLSTVTTWLDGQGARSCQRERLAEGVQFVCQLASGTVLTTKGTSDEDALQKLVQAVVRHKQEVTLSQR